MRNRLECVRKALAILRVTRFLAQPQQEIPVANSPRCSCSPANPYVNPTAHKAPLPSSRVCRLATTLIELTCPPSLARWRSRLFNKAARKMHSRYIVVVAVAFAIQRRQSLPLTC